MHRLESCLGELPEPSCVQCMKYSKFSSMLAICYLSNIVILYLYSSTECVLLNGSDEESVNDCDFVGEDKLVSIDDDGRCILWDISNGCQIFVSSGEFSFPKCLSYNPNTCNFVIGTEDNQLITMKIAGPELKETNRINLESEDDDGIVSITYSEFGTVLVGCHKRVLEVDIPSSKCLRETPLSCLSVSTFSFMFGQDATILAISTSCLGPGVQLTHIKGVTRDECVGSEQNPENPESCELSDSGGAIDDDERNSETIDDDARNSGRHGNPFEEDERENCEDNFVSVFPSTDPVDKSPLRSTPMKRKRPQPAKKKRTIDKPVTFHKTIRSSGYGSVPPVQRMFSGVVKPKRKVKGSRGIETALMSRLSDQKTYPCDCGVTRQRQTFSRDNDIEAKLAHGAAVLKVCYSPDGSLLGSCSTDKSTRVTRLPLSQFQGDGKVLVGHQGVVSSVDFSYSSTIIGGSKIPQRPLILTGSQDGTARIWCSSLSSPLATLAPPRGEGVDYGPVTQASFYYLDKFVLVGCGSQVRLHQYLVDEDCAVPSKNLKAQQQKNRRKQQNGGPSPNQRIVANWDSKTEAKTVTSFSAINSFLSHLVVVARSDRSIVVIDTGANTYSRLIPSTDTDDRATHTIVLPNSTTYASHPTSAYDMFISSSTSAGGSISVWDLRARERVQCLQGHKNRVHPVGAAISPCMRYIATGSEDNSCYIYDIRKGQPVERLWDKHRDTVSDVAYHPLHPQLVTACFDGKLRFYTV
mmetsp:Transcript_5240/g.9262  ORF Transcript_5240/g.9262 Transcript_5240/m.9262 type:complete len:751 (+) Transcript_5240:258-2510(+)